MCNIEQQATVKTCNFQQHSWVTPACNIHQHLWVTPVCNFQQQTPALNNMQHSATLTRISSIKYSATCLIQQHSWDAPVCATFNKSQQLSWVTQACNNRQRLQRSLFFFNNVFIHAIYQSNWQSSTSKQSDCKTAATPTSTQQQQQTTTTTTTTTIIAEGTTN